MKYTFLVLAKPAAFSVIFTVRLQRTVLQRTVLPRPFSLSVFYLSNAWCEPKMNIVRCS